MALLEEIKCTLNSLILFFPLFNLYFCLIKINILKYKVLFYIMHYNILYCEISTLNLLFGYYIFIFLTLGSK